MPLSSGTRLGPYEVLGPIGSGGMGEVYRARDTRLGRDVAAKVLPDALARDTDALARFEVEARAVAALSHPNILALHDVGEAAGVRYAVTELLEGETLRAVLGRGPLGVRRALEVAGQVAEALAAAHEKAIVHRDVKPENVYVTADGRVKLLDFGLAAKRSMPGSSGVSASPTARFLTEEGTVVGTAAYMSPEQARGDLVDFRTDQFALGILLYELLTGVRPFVRETAAETMAAIIREEPEPLARLSPHVPAPVRWLVERLLTKEPEGRYASTRDVARELASLRTHLSETTPGLAGAAASRLRGARLAPIGLALLLGASAPTALLLLRHREKEPAPARFEVRLPDGHFLVPHSGALALSPDGRLLVVSAFVWKRPYDERGEPRLFLRPLDSLDFRPIPGTEGAVQPVFSPDGRNVAFAVESEGRKLLRRVPVSGGAVQTICECEAGFGAAWAPDGSILFASMEGPLKRVAATGGTPEPATTLDVASGEVSHRLPHLLPDGRTVLYTALRWTDMGAMAWKRARVWAGRAGEKERTLVLEGGSDGRWVPPGALLLGREGTLLAASFDSSARRLSGSPAPIQEGVRHSIWTSASVRETGVVQVAASATGALAWSPGGVDPPLAYPRFWIDASGNEVPLDPGAPPQAGPGSRVSADGGRVLISCSYPGTQVEVLDLARRSRRRATHDANPLWAIWGPGPDRITFSSDHEGPTGIYTRRLDAGPEEVETLFRPTTGADIGLGSWSRDGRTLAFVRWSAETQYDIWLLERGKAPRPIVANRFNEMYPDISPDGRWLLYASDESGRLEVFSRALFGDGGTFQVSAGEGREPLWSRDGASALYWQRVEGRPGVRALFRVKVKGSASALAVAVPERLLEYRYATVSPGHGWDVAPDGRFVVARTRDEAERRAWWDRVLSNRVVVDTGGIARLLADARTAP